MKTTEDLNLLRAWVTGEQKALEWRVGDRTFQISGVRGVDGLFERFFPRTRGGHPTRTTVSEEEIGVAIQSATTPIELYRNERGSGQFFANAEEALFAAKAWVEGDQQ